MSFNQSGEPGPLIEHMEMSVKQQMELYDSLPKRYRKLYQDAVINFVPKSKDQLSSIDAARRHMGVAQRLSTIATYGKDYPTNICYEFNHTFKGI